MITQTKRINKRNIRYFELARKASEFSDFDMHHLGCVIIYKNYILSVGYNTNKTHPIQMQYNKYRNFNNPDNVKHKLHAEVAALSKIKDLDIDWSKVEIYIYRENKNGKPALSYPCIGCRNYIKIVGIKHLYYTIDGDYQYERLG
jgi:deoxycytidylate deaminase